MKINEHITMIIYIYIYININTNIIIQVGWVVACREEPTGAGGRPPRVDLRCNRIGLM